MKLLRRLANLGYGSRKDVALMLRNGWVTDAAGNTLGADDTTAHEDVRVDDEPLDPPPGLLLMLHKPVGHTSPRTHLPKVYRATLASDLRGDEAAVFAAGELLLDGEDKPLAPAAMRALSPREAELVLVEGRYHQVRRMFAAVGNHVTALHRSAIGGLDLGELAPGQWRLLDPQDRARLFGYTAAS